MRDLGQLLFGTQKLWGDLMEIQNITINNHGHITCKSVFYSSSDILNDANYTFNIGINKLVGSIDSGNWALSYLLSMYNSNSKDFILFKDPMALVNNNPIPLDELTKISCYMDKTYPMFSKKATVKKLIEKALKQNKINFSLTEIKNMFCLSDERFERPIKGVGNEIFNAMAAIAFAHNKQIFCFPWFSKKRFDGYHEHLKNLLKILEGLEKIVILPLEG